MPTHGKSSGGEVLVHDGDSSWMLHTLAMQETALHKAGTPILFMMHSLPKESVSMQARLLGSSYYICMVTTTTEQYVLVLVHKYCTVCHAGLPTRELVWPNNEGEIKKKVDGCMKMYIR